MEGKSCNGREIMQWKGNQAMEGKSCNGREIMQWKGNHAMEREIMQWKGKCKNAVDGWLCAIQMQT